MKAHTAVVGHFTPEREFTKLVQYPINTAYGKVNT